MRRATANPGATQAGLVLKLTRRFAAPRPAVFRAWTDPEALAAWFGPDAVRARKVELDLRPGGRYRLEMVEQDGSVHPLSGIYREIRPPERLVFTWVWGRGDLADVEMLVTIELTEVEGGTELTLTHERLASERAREKHAQGWTSTLDCLDRHLSAEGFQPTTN